MTGHDCPKCGGLIRWTPELPEAHEEGELGAGQCQECDRMFPLERFQGGLYLMGHTFEPDEVDAIMAFVGPEDFRIGRVK